MNLWASGPMDGARTRYSQESSRAAGGVARTHHQEHPASLTELQGRLLSWEAPKEELQVRLEG